MWSLVTYSKCFKWNCSKEQMVINLSAMLLLKVRLCLILCIYVSNNDYVHDIIFAAPGFEILEY